MRAHLQHASNWWRPLRCFSTVAFDEVFPLEGHTMLDRDAASECDGSINVSVRNRLRMIEAPVQPLEGDVAVNLLKDIQESLDGFVIRGVQAECPALFNEQPGHTLELCFKGVIEVRSWLEEILKVRACEDEILSGAIETQGVVALIKRC